MKYNSALMSSASGSAGGLTASRNKGGSYFRKRSIPTNPNSAFQQAFRTLFKAIMNAWTNTLTAAQRSGWNTYAVNTPLIDSLGASRVITDNAMYLRSNSVRLQNGLSRIDGAPVVFDLGSFTQPTFSVTASTSFLSVAFTTGDSWHASGGGLFIYASRPQNASINFFKGPFRLVGVISGTATSPQTFTLPFAAGTTASAMFLKSSVSQPDGRLSTESIVKSTPV